MLSMRSLDRTFRGALLVAALILLPSAVRAAEVIVQLGDFYFDPSVVTIDVGDTVTWINGGSLDHDVVARDGSFSAPGGFDTYSHTFTAPGTYEYYCTPHGAFHNFGMFGTVIVREAEAEPCVASERNLCLNGGRFKVEVAWRTATSNGNGTAVPIPSAPDSGLFYFFGPSNLEMLIKVLNGCGLNNRYWVFFAATTNVEFTVTVTDTQTGQVKTYSNPLNHAAEPIQDTNAFTTCP